MNFIEVSFKIFKKVQKARFGLFLEYFPKYFFNILVTLSTSMKTKKKTFIFRIQPSGQGIAVSALFHTKVSYSKFLRYYHLLWRLLIYRFTPILIEFFTSGRWYWAHKTDQDTHKLFMIRDLLDKVWEEKIKKLGKCTVVEWIISFVEREEFHQQLHSSFLFFLIGVLTNFVPNLI